MQLLHHKEFLHNIKELPFCFQKEYQDLYPGIHILEHESCYAPVKITRVKSFKMLQFQFPPISSSGKRLTGDKEQAYCVEAINFIGQNKLAHRIVQPTNYCLFNAVPAKSIHSSFGTYRISLQDKNEKELLANMQARYRTAINQVSTLDVSIKFGLSELNSFHKLHEETMNRTDAHIETRSSLNKQLSALPNNTLLATIYIDGKIQGGLFIIYSNYSAYYFHGASADTTQASGAIKYLHYKMMCLLKEKNVKYYDFVGARLSNVEGSKLEGIQNFKKRFGSELVKGYLWKVDIDKKICRSFDLLLKIKCKLKGTSFPKDIIEQEKNKAPA